MAARVIRLRRSAHEMHIEIMPLIDVIFLLLTFFIYAMVLMIPAEVLPMQTQRLQSGTRATPAPAVTVSLDQGGGLYVDRDPVELDDVLGRLKAAQAQDPDTVVYLAVEKNPGAVDRAPILIALYDRLANAGLDIRLLGSLGEDSPVDAAPTGGLQSPHDE